MYAGALAFLGVQRRRRGDHRRCHPVRRPTPCSRGAMFPKLFDLGPLTVYSYGVLLAAAYLGGLQFALVRARKPRPGRGAGHGPRHLHHRERAGGRQAPAGAGRCRPLPARAGRPAVAGPLGRRVLRRADPRRAGRALVRAQAPAADVAHRRRDRAGHRVRPCRRPTRLLPGGLLLRPRDDRAVGRDVHQSRSRRRTSARRSACRCTPRSSTRRAPKPSSWGCCSPSNTRGGRSPGGPSGATCSSTASRAS